MKLDHWKNYAPITRVTTFDANAAGPITTDLQVISNTHASDAYPDARIGLVVTGLGSVMLTPGQSSVLRAHLERAERDARAGGPMTTAATGGEGRCESCSGPIAAGELVHVIDDGAGECIVVHAGLCRGERRDDG
jgi:hypothetical protein